MKEFAPLNRTSAQGLGGGMFPRKCEICGKPLNSLTDVRMHTGEHFKVELPKIMSDIKRMRAAKRGSKTR